MKEDNNHYKVQWIESLEDQSPLLRLSTSQEQSTQGKLRHAETEDHDFQCVYDLWSNKIQISLQFSYSRDTKSLFTQHP